MAQQNHQQHIKSLQIPHLIVTQIYGFYLLYHLQLHLVVNLFIQPTIHPIQMVILLVLVISTLIPLGGKLIRLIKLI